MFLMLLSTRVESQPTSMSVADKRGSTVKKPKRSTGGQINQTAVRPDTSKSYKVPKIRCCGELRQRVGPKKAGLE